MLRYCIAAVVAGLCLPPPAARAGFIDLTTSGAQGTATAAIGGTNWFVQQGDIQPSGTGVFDPFLTIQRKGSEQGFNTGNATLDYDTKRIANPQNPGDGWTRSLLLGQMVAVNGYYVFKLDINEPQSGTSGLLSLNQIQIFQSNVDLGTPGNYSVTGASNNKPGVLTSTDSNTELFRLNNSVTNYTEIKLDSGLSHGSGSSDMFLYVKASLFANSPNSFITLYSQFGTPPGTYSSTGGFEEWASNSGRTPTPVPAPAGLILALTGMPVLGLRAWVRRRATATA